MVLLSLGRSGFEGFDGLNTDFLLGINHSILDHVEGVYHFHVVCDQLLCGRKSVCWEIGGGLHVPHDLEQLSRVLIEEISEGLHPTLAFEKRERIEPCEELVGIVHSGSHLSVYAFCCQLLNTHMKISTPLYAILLLAAALQGCKTPTIIKPATGASSGQLSSVVEHTIDAVSDIKRDAAAIVVETQVARESLAMPTPTPAAVDLAVQSLDKIDSKATNIIEAADDITAETERLETLTEEVDRLEKSLSSLQIMVEGTRAKALEKLYGYISLFWVIGFLLIAGGAAVAFFLNKTYGGSLALIGLLMLGFASASQYYLEEIAMVGAVLLVLGFLTALWMVIWSSINSKRNITAIREVVEMIQILKETMTEDEQERIFGQNGVASNVQSDLTKEIVAKIREQNGFKKLEEARKAGKSLVTDPIIVIDHANLDDQNDLAQH